MIIFPAIDLRHGRCVRLAMPDAARVELLLQEYGHFADDTEAFCRLLDGLTELQGHDRVAQWQAMARAGRWAELFGVLMAQHYDPLYDRSMRRSYADLARAPEVLLADGSDAALDAAVAALRTLGATADDD